MRDGQLALFVVTGDGHSTDEADLAHRVLGEAALECFLVVLHHVLVPSRDEGVVDVNTEDCEGVVASICVHAQV